MKKWIVKNPDMKIVQTISKKLGISSLLASLLVNRGIKNVSEAKEFLNPEIDKLFSPFLLADMERAVGRIRQALDKREKILVYGDSDVDGITSVAVLVNTLSALGGDVCWYVSADEGYGLYKPVIDAFFKQSVTLVITVDCGITAHSEIDYIKSLGGEVIVTDHHEIASEGIPKAFAVVDPKRPDSPYPFRELAGCAVAYKVAEALMMSYGRYYNRELVVWESVKDTKDNIIELVAIKIRNSFVVDQFREKAKADNEYSMLKRFMAFAGNALLIGYDAHEEIKMLNERLSKPERYTIDNEIFDISEIERRYIQDSIRGFSGLSEAFDLNVRHNDVVDRLCAKYEIFMKLDHMDDLRMKFFRESNLDLIALGTVADVVPLVQENRVFVKWGLKALSDTRKIGLKALFDRIARKGTPIVWSAKTISWDIAPVLNAAGRLNQASVALDLLLCDDKFRAAKLASEVIALNDERRKMQTDIAKVFKPLIREQCDIETDKILIADTTDLAQGVTGIIASQFVRQYNRPVMLIIAKGDEAIGSGRSVQGLDLLEMLEEARDLLTRFGGHEQAAGFTLPVKNIPEFKQRLKAVANKKMTSDISQGSCDIDAEVNLNEVNIELVKELALLEPYGKGNPHPMFTLSNLTVEEHGTLGADGKHLKLKVTKDLERKVEAVGWSMGSKLSELLPVQSIDVVCNVEVNVWASRSSVRLSLVDLRPSFNGTELRTDEAELRTEN